jgi:hypothetical protein
MTCLAPAVAPSVHHTFQGPTPTTFAPTLPTDLWSNQACAAPGSVDLMALQQHIEAQAALAAAVPPASAGGPGTSNRANAVPKMQPQLQHKQQQQQPHMQLQQRQQQQPRLNHSPSRATGINDDLDWNQFINRQDRCGSRCCRTN